jgi:hypothetical protein
MYSSRTAIVITVTVMLQILDVSQERLPLWQAAINDAPVRMNETAVWTFIVASPGRTLLRASTLKAQPRRTEHPSRTTPIPIATATEPGKPPSADWNSRDISRE